MYLQTSYRSKEDADPHARRLSNTMCSPKQWKILLRLMPLLVVVVETQANISIGSVKTLVQDDETSQNHTQLV
jgi:hypothetical protein